MYGFNVGANIIYLFFLSLLTTIGFIKGIASLLVNFFLSFFYYIRVHQGNSFRAAVSARPRHHSPRYCLSEHLIKEGRTRRYGKKKIACSLLVLVYLYKG